MESSEVVMVRISHEEDGCSGCHGSHVKYIQEGAMNVASNLNYSLGWGQPEKLRETADSIEDIREALSACSYGGEWRQKPRAMIADAIDELESLRAQLAAREEALKELVERWRARGGKMRPDKSIEETLRLCMAVQIEACADELDAVSPSTTGRVRRERRQDYG